MTFKIKSWNHRADISAQTYLKLSQKGKQNVTECILENFAVIPQKNSIVFEYLVQILRGVEFFAKTTSIFSL